MTSRLSWSRAAESDLDEIWFDIALNDAQAADRQVERIAEFIFKLSDFPRLGRARPEFGTSIHGLVKDNYVILYEVMGDESVEVKRILHGRRNLALLYDSGEP